MTCWESNPPAHPCLILPVNLTKLLTHVPLLWNDLKPIHINYECRKQHKTCEIAEKNSPSNENEQEANVHRISTYSVDPAHNETGGRSEEHTSELQSRPHLVCR